MNNIADDFECKENITREKALDIVLRYGRICKKHGGKNHKIIEEVDSVIQWKTILSVITKEEAIRAYKQGIAGR